jgi:hypothetical protein
VYYDFEYENTFIESAIKVGGIGITTTRKTKKVGISTLKDLVEENKLNVTDAETITELSYFEERGDSYESKNGVHDDLVMTLVIFSWFVSSSAFGDYSETDLRKMVYESRLKEIDEEMSHMGIFSSNNDLGDAINPHYDKLKNDLLDWSKP